MAAALVATRRTYRILNHSWMYVRHFGDTVKSLKLKQTLQRSSEGSWSPGGKFLRCLLLCPFPCFQILAAKRRAKAPSAQKKEKKTSKKNFK